MKRDKERIFEKFIAVQDELNARIAYDTETNRKRRANITVTENGAPVSDVKIKFKQKNHEFKFGANCFMLDELETPEKNEAYKKYFAEAFNLATIPFYWDTLEPEQGKPRYAADSPKIYRRPAPDLCVDYCLKNNIEPKLHCLVYDNFTPQWYRDATVPEQKRLIAKRMQEISERYCAVIPDIEVINEVQSWKREGKPAFFSEPDYVDWSFKMAERYFPNNNLIINEDPDVAQLCGNKVADRQLYYLLIKCALADGARIDKIGIQHHIWQYHPDDYENTRVFFDPDCIYHTLETYSRFGKEIQMTEVTFPARGAEAEDEDYQAEVLERMYRLWFSYKDMQAIIYWNLVDGYASGAVQGDMTAGENVHYGGLINFDMTPKKAYYKLLDLIHKEWHTEGLTGTDEGGKCSFRGFCGAYELEIHTGDKVITKEINLSKYKKNDFTITL